MILLFLCMRNWTWRTHGAPIVYGLHSYCVFMTPFVWRNLKESEEICERKSSVNSKIQPGTVLPPYQPNAAITYCITVLKVPSINEGELKIATV